MIVWYDGLQQWAYVKATEEVNLTEPTTEEIATVNHYILINNYKKDFYIKTLKSKSSKESIAELTPKKKGTNVESGKFWSVAYFDRLIMLYVRSL